MRICIDISAAMTPHPSGIGRYAHQLVCALGTLSNGPELSLFYNRRQQNQPPVGLEFQPRSIAPVSDKPWRAFLLTGLMPPRSWGQTIHDCDLFHGTDSITPRLSQPAVITIHDLTTLLFPQHHSPLNRWYQRIALPVMIKRASTIITDSEATRGDCISRYQIASDKIHTVPIGVDHQRFFPRDRLLAQSKVRQHLGISAPYLLSVGTLEPRKNLLRLVEAYSQLDSQAPPLVIAGAKGWGDHPIAALIEQRNLQNRIHIPGFVPDELLPDLYAGAEMFIYPSIYEGFGLPPLEAMACGAPVITSNCSSLPEVTGDAALLIDPQDVNAITAAMDRLLKDTTLAASLSDQGIKRAALFTWERTAKATLELYKETLADSLSN